MTGPEEPGDDWAFPEVSDPASVQLPREEPEQVYDTGSDAWWRQQAETQRRAADSELTPPAETSDALEDPETPEVAVDPVAVEPTPVPPQVPAAEPSLVEPPAVEPVVASPSPLDRDWLPPDLPALTSPAAAPAPELANGEPPAPPARPNERSRPAVDDLPTAMHVPLTRPPHQGDRIGPGRAIAGALLAVGGVGLGIGAFLVYGHEEPKGNVAAVEAPPSASASSTTAATSRPSATATVTPKAVTPTTATPATPSPRPVVAPASPALAPVAPVDVLNNSRIRGLADRAASRFRAGGWPVPLTGNYSGGTIARTTIYYAPGQRPSAERFAREFGIPRVLPRFAGLPGSGLTVVLTRDYR